MRFLFRLLLAFALVTGAGRAVPLPPEAPACGCCGGPAEPCPCAPAAPASPSHRSPCNAPAPLQTAVLERAASEAQPRLKPEARPLEGLPLQAGCRQEAAVPGPPPRGRAPDRGRHLAALGTFRI